MRIQTALRERNTRLLQVFASVRNFTFLSRVVVWRRRTCCPRLTPPRGARYKSTPKTQVFKTSREPLARFHSHPASFTRPPRSVLQSTTLEPLGQGVGGDDFSSFVRPLLPATPSIYWTSGVWSREVFPNSFSSTQPAAVSGDSPTTYQPLQPPSTPAEDFGVALTSLSRTRREPRLGRAPEDTEPPRVFLAGVPVGVGDGVRTRDLRNHNPAL